LYVLPIFTVWKTIDYPIENMELLSYEGNTVNGLPSGNGTVVFRNGEKFVGQFENGIVDGLGTLTYPGTLNVITINIWLISSNIIKYPKTIWHFYISSVYVNICLLCSDMVCPKRSL
jgi:hypothetical protein